MLVLLYIPSIDRKSGGTTKFIESLTGELARLAEVHLLTHPSDAMVELPGVHIHTIPSFGFSFIRQVKNLIRTLHPDVVHVNGCWLPACAMVQRIAQRLGVKVALSPHGMLEPHILHRHYLTRKLPALILYQRRAVKTADILVSTAESETETLLKYRKPNEIKMVRLGIDVQSIKMRDSWDVQKKILFLSRVHEKKGIEFLLSAAAHIHDQLSGYQIIIAGEGDPDYINSLRSETQRLGLTDIVVFAGGVYGEKKWQLFQEADVFVLPTKSENFGLAVVEALASGTPVITTVGAPWQDLNTFNCGAWIQIGSQPLADALLNFISLPTSERKQMGLNGRKLVEDKYSAASLATNMLSLYKSIL